MSADRLWLDPEIVVPLVRAAQESDDPSHVDRLLNALRPMLMCKLGHRQPREVAEDLVQTALVKIARSYDDMRPAESVAVGYLVRLARNVLLDHARSTRRAVQAAEKARTADVLPTNRESGDAVPRALELKELAVAVRQATERLPSPKLRAVVLGYLRELGITADNVRVRWARAKRLLRSDLATVASEWGVAERPSPRGPAASENLIPPGRVSVQDDRLQEDAAVRRLGGERAPLDGDAGSVVGIRGVG